MSNDVKHDNYLQDLFDQFLEEGYNFEGARIMVEKTIEKQNN